MNTLRRSSWLRLTEERNALDYLERAYKFIREAATEPLAWKWVVIALHGALYGFAICACKGTNPNNVTIKTKTGKERLITLKDALKRCEDPKSMRIFTMSRHLQLSSQQRESIHKLRDVLRNPFEHYTPRLWAIEVDGMPQIAIDVLGVIRFLALETENCVHLNLAQRRSIESLVMRSIRTL